MLPAPCAGWELLVTLAATPSAALCRNQTGCAYYLHAWHMFLDATYRTNLSGTPAAS